jgi:glycerol-3-phosphate acyltransferase PlsY
MNEVLRLVGVCLGSYLLGSIPFGVIVSKRVKGIDIQKVGSGNIGGTNVGRELGFKYGVLVGGLDACKGALPVLLFLYCFCYPWWLVGLAWLCAFLGNLFPVWLKFRGGKGVGVFFGGLLALLSWQACLIILGCWIAIFLFFTRRKMSAANLILASSILLFILTLPVLLYMPLIILTIVLFLWWSHRKNIERLARGEEPSLRLPSALAFLDKLPDDVISLAVDKLQTFIKALQKYQNEKKPRD